MAHTRDNAGLQSTAGNESSATIRERVRQARKRQNRRQGVSNAHLDAQALREHVHLDADARNLFARASIAMTLSLRV